MNESLNGSPDNESPWTSQSIADMGEEVPQWITTNQQSVMRLHSPLLDRRQDARSKPGCHSDIKGKFPVISTDSLLTVLSVQEQQFLNALDFSEEVEDMIPIQYTNTCEWILKQPQFDQWRHSDNVNHHSLWILGSPGSGKSVLAKFILSKLRETRALESVSSVACLALGHFLDARSSQGAKILVLVKSLLHQLLSAEPTLFRNVHSKSVFRDSEKTLSSLYDIFLNALQDRAALHTYVVIDGYDECASELKHELLKLVKNIESMPGVKLLCTSRELPQLAAFG